MTNDDYMKEFEAYIKVIDYYGGKTHIHPVIVKEKLANMKFTTATQPKKKNIRQKKRLRRNT